MPLKTLVVDNNPVVLRALSAILEKEGCEVQVSENGLVALEILKTYQPDIVFTDLVMPQVSGEQLCKILRKSGKHKNVYIVVVSAIAIDDIESILKRQYFDKYIAKGNLKDLRVQLLGILDQYQKRTWSGKPVTEDSTPMISDVLPNTSTVASELLKEKKHLHRLLEHLEEGVVELSDDGRVVRLNAAARRILQVNEEEIIGMPFANFSWGKHTRMVARWLNNHKTDGFSERYEILENDPLTINNRIVTAGFYPGWDGESRFGLCILHDITRQYIAEKNGKELDNALQLVAKMDAMSCMAGGIAHDFNNLFTIICGNLDILNHSGLVAAKTNELNILDNARTAACMAIDLTRKISNFSPFGFVRRKRCLLAEIVEQVVFEFVQDTSADCRLEAHDDGLVVNIDQEQVKAALRNVLQNALEAETEGNQIRVETGEIKFDTPQLFSGQYVPAGRYACVSIQDFGCGIDREHLLRIFDPYFTTKDRGATKGIGLGLTIVYSTFRNHGGYVVVESDFGAGTRASCYLPAFGQQESMRVRSDDLNGSTDHPLKVLVVEYDMQLLDVDRIMLGYLGYEPIIVSHVNDALDHLKSIVTDGEKVHAVLIDPAIESKFSHVDTCQRFKEIDPQITMIVTGGAALDPILDRCEKYGYTNALPKPFTLDSLRHVLACVKER